MVFAPFLSLRSAVKLPHLENDTLICGGQGETLVPPTAVAGGDEGFVFEFEASDNNNSG